MITIAIVGRPNVGKSSLFNRLTRSRDALVADEPGLTRDRHYGKFKIEQSQYILIDTGGFEPKKKVGIAKEMALQTRLAIDECDLILFVVDAREGLHPIDQHIADIVRKNDKNKILLINKAEGMQTEIVSADFYSFGFKQILSISSAHGEGISLLKEMIINIDRQEEPSQITKNIPKITIIGRPNVGKSTLTNALLGEDRFIVYDKAGTTRDAVSAEFIFNKKEFILTDTAGIRKKGKVIDTIEKFSIIKTLSSIESSDVVILVIDASGGIAAQDMHLIGFVLESGKSIVIALNKWDSVSAYEKEKIQNEIDQKLPFVNFAEKVFVSALKGSGLKLLMNSVIKAFKSSSLKFSTPQINEVLSNAIQTHQPKIIKGIRPKLKFAHQGGLNPPTIIIHGNHLKEISKDYIRYLETFFRKAFELVGTPLRVELKSGKNPYQEKSEKIKKTGLVTRRKNIDDFRKKMKEKKAKKLSQ
jgi:GTP-binding protein